MVVFDTETILNPHFETATGIDWWGGEWQDCGSPVKPKLQEVAAALEGDPPTHTFPTERGKMRD